MPIKHDVFKINLLYVVPKNGSWYLPAELIENRSAGDMGLEFPNLYTYYETPEVTCEDVRKAARDVPVVASNLDKYRRFIFNAAKIVPVPPEDTEISEEEQLEVQQRVNGPARAHLAKPPATSVAVEDLVVPDDHQV